MPQQFQPILTYMSGGYEFAESAREEIRSCLRPHLRDPGDEDTVIRALEEAIGEYKGLLGAGVNDPLRDRKATLAELEALSEKAGALSQTLQDLHPETRERLTEWVEHAPAPGEERGLMAPLFDPQRLQQLPIDVGMLAGRAGLVSKRVEDEERRRGRPTDVAAHDLTSTCRDIFDRHCEGSTAYHNWPKDDGTTVAGPFQELLRLVFEAAGVARSADSYVRELHKRRPENAK